MLQKSAILIHFVKRILLTLLLLVGASFAQAQWLSQSVTLSPGWNAVYLHVDASHTTLDTLVGGDGANPILEIWRWNAGPNVQFTTDPQSPINGGSQWISWSRGAANSPLQRIVGNSGYLVRVETNVVSYTWTVKGKAVAPANDWTTTGLNFLGFATVPNSPPNFDTFLAVAPDLFDSAELYYYHGGDLNSNNPARIFSPEYRNTPVKRGQAFWFRSGTTFNRYFGPLTVDLSSGTAIDFKENGNSSSLRLKNRTASSLTVSVQLLASETPPAGQTAIAGEPPLIIRGAANPTNVTFGYTNLPINTTRSWTLAPQGQPGSELEVVFGLNRAAMSANPGTLFAGILRFTDSLGYSQVDVPVSAKASSTAGLWVGRALATQVGEYLKTYQTAGSSLAMTNGHYIATATNTSIAPTAKLFPLRLIVHNPGAGSNAVMLRQVFYGPDAFTNLVVATKQDALNQNLLGQCRRVTATHLPWSATNTFWGMSGRLGSASNLTASVMLDYNDQASNPFLHSYHPDHDNLNTTFKTVLVPGMESYSVRRDITLSVTPPANDFASQIAGTQSIEGNYLETITVLGLPRAGNTNDTRTFEVRGVFTLNRISDVPTLTVVP